MMAKDYLALKWGTPKAWELKSEAALAAAQAYLDSGPHSASAMLQNDSPAQVEALCALIDAIDGEIRNEWSGEKMTKDEAKAYVRDYDRKSVHG